MVHGASFKLVGGENHSSSILPAERWGLGSRPGGGEGLGGKKDFVDIFELKKCLPSENATTFHLKLGIRTQTLVISNLYWLT